MAGKGDANRTKDLNAYRSSPLWDKIGPDKKVLEVEHNKEECNSITIDSEKKENKD